MMDLRKLKQAMPEIFEQVKRDVKHVLGRQRAGLSLGLVDMGISSRGFIGGMFFSGGTMILMNRRALQVLLATGETASRWNHDACQLDREEIVEAYVYNVLQHEYIHALGFLDEGTCRKITREVSRKVFPENHPVTLMAKHGIGYFFPRHRYAPVEYQFTPDTRSIELVKGFDRSSTVYYM